MEDSQANENSAAECHSLNNSQKLIAAKIKLKKLVQILYNDLENLLEVEEDHEIDPHKNIIENFSKKKHTACDICNQSFPNWTALDAHKYSHHGGLLAISNDRICLFCDKIFRDKEQCQSHTLLKHEELSPAAQKNIDVTKLICCTLCRKHYKDHEHWMKHFKATHNQNFPKHNPWMWSSCTRKGVEIVDDPNAKLYCTICEDVFPYNPNTFHFDKGHGKTIKHKKCLTKFIVDNNRLPVKFLKVVNASINIPGMFHPHELQNSCCCRIFGCEFCEMHVSMKKKFTKNDMVCCTLCNKNFQWLSIESGLDHVKTETHYKSRCIHVKETGLEFEVMYLFKSAGGKIPTVSVSRQ